MSKKVAQLVKIKARNLAGDKPTLLDGEMEVKKWTVDKVMLELQKKLEDATEDTFMPKEDTLRLWNPKDRTQILKGKLGITNTFAQVTKELVEIRFVNGTVAKQVNGLNDFQFHKPKDKKVKNLKEATVADMKEAIRERLEKTEKALANEWLEKMGKDTKDTRSPIYFKNSKVYLSDKDSKNKPSQKAFPKGNGLVEYYYGLTVREYNGSQIYYFPDLDSQETTMGDLKIKIAAQIEGLEEKDIQIWDDEKKETIEIWDDEKKKGSKTTGDFQSDGEVMFKMSKFIARDSTSCRVLLFPGPDLKKDTEETVVGMKWKITEKLNLPLEQIEIYNKDTQRNINDTEKLQKAFPDGEIRYRLKLTTKIPCGFFRVVTLDKDENHDKAQIVGKAVKSNDYEFKQELRLYEIENDFVELQEYRDGKKGGGINLITAEQYEMGRGKLQAEKEEIIARQTRRARDIKRMKNTSRWGINTPQELYLREFMSKLTFINKMRKERRKFVELNFPFTKNQSFYIHNHKRTTTKWVIDMMYQFYTLQRVPDIVRAFNDHRQFITSEAENKTENDDYTLEPLSYYVTDDFDIMPMHKLVFNKYILTKDEENEIYEYNDLSTNQVKKQMPESTYFAIRYFDKVGKKKEVSLKLKDPLTMTIKQLKSYILTITKNTPFIFRFDIENDKKVSELIDMTYKFNDKNKLVRKKTTDPEKPWANVGWESKLDVFTDFKHFDVCFEYDNELTQVQIKEIEREWKKVDTKGTEKISVQDPGGKKEIAEHGMSELTKVYWALFGSHISKDEIKTIYDKDDFTVSLKKFVEMFQKKYDENLPTIQLQNCTYSKVLFNKLFWKATKVAKHFHSEFELKAKVLPRQFQEPFTNNDAGVKDQILIITEDGKTYPLLKSYDKNYSLKDLNITRWSTLKYKVVRNRDFLQDKGEIPIKKDFFKDENPSKVLKKLKMDTQLFMKNLQLKKPPTQWMASEMINFEVPEYLRVAFLKQGKETAQLKPGQLGEPAKASFDMTLDLEKMYVDDIKQIILNQIHSKDREEIDKDNKDQKKDDLDDQVNEQKLRDKDAPVEGKECYLDLHNFKPRRLGLEHIQLSVYYVTDDEYNPYEAHGIRDDKKYAKKKKYVMEDDRKLDFYKMIDVEEVVENGGDEAEEVEADPYGSEDDPYASENDSADGSDAGGEGNDTEKKPEKKKKDLDDKLYIKIELFNVIALQIDDTGLKTPEEDQQKETKTEKVKKFKFINYNDFVQDVADLGKFLKVYDIFTDELRKEKVAAFRKIMEGNNPMDCEEQLEKAREEIEDNELRDEVMRQNLYFLYEKQLVPGKLASLLKKDQITSKLIVNVGLRQNLHRQPDYIVKAEDSYLLNEMRCFVFKDTASTGLKIKQDINTIVDADQNYTLAQKKSNDYTTNYADIQTDLKKVEKNFANAQKDKENFQLLLKLYVNKLVFRALDNKLLYGMYGDISAYMQMIFKLNAKVGHEFTYDNFDKPVYRGINLDQFKMSDYEPDQIKQWCSFTECSTSLKAAYGKSYKPYELTQVTHEQQQKNLDENKVPKEFQQAVIENSDKLPNKNQDLIIFKIFICKHNSIKEASPATSAPTSIKLNIDKDYTEKHGKDAQAVLLLPFFTFRVAHIQETREIQSVDLLDHHDKPCSNRGKITYVTLMEVPYQKTTVDKPFGPAITLDSLILSNSSNANQNDRAFQTAVTTKKEAFPDIVAEIKTSDYELFRKELWQHINSTVRTVIVIQCKLGLAFIKDLYNGLNTPTNIKRIFIFFPPTPSPPKQNENQVQEVGSEDLKIQKEVKALIEKVKVNTKDVPGINWAGDPINKLDLDLGDFEEDGQFIVDVNGFLASQKKEDILMDNTTEAVKEKSLNDRAFELLKEICEKARMDEAELNERLNKDVKYLKAKRAYEKSEKDAEGNDERKAAMDVLQKEREKHQGETEKQRYDRKTNGRDEKMKAQLDKKKSDAFVRNDKMEAEWKEKKAEERRIKKEQDEKLKADQEKRKKEEEEEKKKKEAEGN